MTTCIPLPSKVRVWEACAHSCRCERSGRGPINSLAPSSVPHVAFQLLGTGCKASISGNAAVYPGEQALPAARKRRRDTVTDPEDAVERAIRSKIMQFARRQNASTGIGGLIQVSASLTRDSAMQAAMAAFGRHELGARSAYSEALAAASSVVTGTAFSSAEPAQPSAAVPAGNVLVAQLHAERLARNQSRGASTAACSAPSNAAAPAQQLTLLTYNLWFQAWTTCGDELACNIEYCITSCTVMMVVGWLAGRCHAPRTHARC